MAGRSGYGGLMDVDTDNLPDSLDDTDYSSSLNDAYVGLGPNVYLARSNPNFARNNSKAAEDETDRRDEKGGEGTEEDTEGDGGSDGNDINAEDEEGDEEVSEEDGEGDDNYKDGDDEEMGEVGNEIDEETDGEGDEEDGEDDDDNSNEEDEAEEEDIFKQCVATEFHGDFGSLWLLDMDDPMSFYGLVTRLLEPGAKKENGKLKLRRWFVEVKNTNRWSRQHTHVYEFALREAWKDSYNSNIRPILWHPDLKFTAFLHKDDIERTAAELSESPFIWVHRLHKRNVESAKRDNFLWWPDPPIRTNDDGNTLETYHSRSKNFMSEAFRFLFPEARSRKHRSSCIFKYRLVGTGTREEPFFPNRAASALSPEFQEELRKKLRKAYGSNSMAPVVEMTISLMGCEAVSATAYYPTLMEGAEKRVIPPKPMKGEVPAAPRRRKLVQPAPQKVISPSSRAISSKQIAGGSLSTPVTERHGRTFVGNHTVQRTERPAPPTIERRGGLFGENRTALGIDGSAMTAREKPAVEEGYRGFFGQPSNSQPPMPNPPIRESEYSQRRVVSPWSSLEKTLSERTLQDHIIPLPDSRVEKERTRFICTLTPVVGRLTSPPRFGSIGGVRNPYTVPRVPTASEYLDLQNELVMIENEVLQKEAFCRVCARIFEFMDTERIKEHYKLHQNPEERCPKCALPMMGLTTVVSCATCGFTFQICKFLSRNICEKEKMRHIDTHSPWYPCPFEGCNRLIGSMEFKEMRDHYSEHNQEIMRRRIPCSLRGCHADLKHLSELQRKEHAQSHQIGVRLNPRFNEAAGGVRRELKQPNPRADLKLCLFCDKNFDQGEKEEEIMKHITENHKDRIIDMPVEDCQMCLTDPNNCRSHVASSSKTLSKELEEEEEQRATSQSELERQSKQSTPPVTPHIPGLTLTEASPPSSEDEEEEGEDEIEEIDEQEQDAEEDNEDGKGGGKEKESSDDERPVAALNLGPRGTNFKASEPTGKLTKRLAKYGKKGTPPVKGGGRKPGSVGDAFMHCAVCFTYVHRMQKTDRERHKQQCDRLNNNPWIRLTVDEGRAKRTSVETEGGTLEQNCPICFKNVVDLPFKKRDEHKRSCGGQRLPFKFLKPEDAEKKRNQYAAMKKGQAHYQRRYCNVCFAQVHSMGKAREKAHLTKCDGESVLLDKGTAAERKVSAQNSVKTAAKETEEPEDRYDTPSGPASPAPPKPMTTEFSLSYNYPGPIAGGGKHRLACYGTTISGRPASFLHKLNYFASNSSPEEGLTMFRMWLGSLVATDDEKEQNERELGAVRAFVQFLRDNYEEAGGVVGGDAGDAIKILMLLHRWLIAERGIFEEELNTLNEPKSRNQGKRKRSLADDEGREDHENSADEGGSISKTEKSKKDIAKRAKENLRALDKGIFERIMAIEDVRAEVEQYGKEMENEFFDDLAKPEVIKNVVCV